MYASYLMHERSDPIDPEHDPFVEALIAGEKERVE
jgi:hypothetical protein